MLRSITLLERLSRAARGEASRTLREDRPAVLRSVLRNLANILNTRVGSAAAQPDLGVPSPHELMQGFPGTVDDARKAIKSCIVTYEPRLTNVVVTSLVDEAGTLAIRFQVTAQLAGGTTRDPVSFRTAVTPDGILRIQDG